MFGFAQSVEQAAAPLTAARAIGSWFGTGEIRGTALVFVVAGGIGVLVVLGPSPAPPTGG